MKRITMLLAVLFMFIATSTFTQTIKTEVYTNAGYGIDTLFTSGSLSKNESKLNVKDVFLGVDYSFTDNFSANTNIRYNGYDEKLSLYTASINYMTNVSKDLDAKLSLGKTESFWYNYTNELWNNYAIDNVISEKFGFFDRTKIGFNALLINKNITGAVEISNGSDNKNKSYSFNVFVTPLDNFKIGAFYNYRNLDSITNGNSFGGNIYYKLITKKSGNFKIYGEYISYKNINDDLNLSKKEAQTLFGEYEFNNSPFSLLARFDNYYNQTSHQQYITGGVNYSPNGLYKFGLNWRNFNDLKISKSHNEVYFTASFVL